MKQGVFSTPPSSSLLSSFSCLDDVVSLNLGLGEDLVICMTACTKIKNYRSLNISSHLFFLLFNNFGLLLWCRGREEKETGNHFLSIIIIYYYFHLGLKNLIDRTTILKGDWFTLPPIISYNVVTSYRLFFFYTTSHTIMFSIPSSSSQYHRELYDEEK